MTAVQSLAGTLAAIIAEGPATGAVAVRHVERDERFSHDGDAPYPAASVFKVPVLVEAFRQIGRGGLALTDRWEMTEEDKSTGSGVLTRLSPGLQPTVRDLLTLMIIISDNTATDMLVRCLDPERISATMRDLGYQQTRVVRGSRDLLTGILGNAPPSLAPFEMAQHLRANPPDPQSGAFTGGTEQNSSTAHEMADLFARIHTGDGMDAIGVDAAARAEMRRILLLQQLNDRLPRFLPPTVPVAHKTGSLGGPWAVRNDAGLLDLGDRGTVAMAVFTRTRMPAGASPEESNHLLTTIDEQIARMALAVYDHYAT